MPVFFCLPSRILVNARRDSKDRFALNFISNDEVPFV